MFTDLHNHTSSFSPDASCDYKTMIMGAKDAGLPRLAFTEHYELDYPHKDDPLCDLFDIDAYVREFPSWKEYASSIGGPELLMGIEFGYQSHIASEIDSVAGSYPLDVVLLSNHLFRDEDVYFSSECYKLPIKERHAEYIGLMAEMADKCHNYDVVAHFDYINRYSINKDDFVLLSHCKREFENLFETLIARDKALEINTRSIDKQLQKKSSFVMPDAQIIKKYVDMGGKLISLGSDSHNTSTLGIHFAETASYLKSLGVNEVCYFKNRQVCLETI